MVPIMLVVLVNSVLFFRIVVSFCSQKRSLSSTQTQGQRRRLQVSGSAACFVVSGTATFRYNCLNKNGYYEKYTHFYSVL